jgi:hypothetical protein
MSLAHGSIKKNGNVLLNNVRLWVNCEADASGKQACWGYLNPEWEDPIGVNDPDKDADPRYELELENGDTLAIRIWDHRDVHFVQCNQNGYRTVHFETAS